MKKSLAVDNVVITCVDDGPTGSAAALVGGSLARRLCSPLMLATVMPVASHARGGDYRIPSLLPQGRSLLLRQGRTILAAAAAGVGPDPELWVEFGEPAERLTSLAQRKRAGLLVVTAPTVASAARSQLGCVYLALAGTSPCPVVIVPPSVDDLPRGHGPIVCGVDGSDESLAAIGVAVALARRLEAPVQLVHVAERPRLAARPGDRRGYAARLVASHAAAMRVLLRAEDVSPAALDLRVELGNPAECLADVAAREEALMIVNGSQGRGSTRSRLLGSVSSELALSAVQPLVLVPQGAGAGRPGQSRTPTEEARPPGRVRVHRPRPARPAITRVTSGRR